MDKSHRRVAREKAVFCIYQWLLVKPERAELTAFLNEVPVLLKDAEAFRYANELIDKTLENQTQLTNVISKYLKKGWSFERLSYLEQSILLVGACEILEFDLDEHIVMNEAVELAKKYCDEQSYRFINGVLMQLM